MRRNTVRLSWLGWAVLACWAIGAQAATPSGQPPPLAETPVFEDFEITGRIVGFQGVAPFVDFLEAALRGEVDDTNPLASLFERNLLLFALAILGGGLLLNLTPCVLPMIPINLGIIGAGAQASSRRNGFLLGSAYGLGITLAYGALGLVSVLTGAAFGRLQSSPWFNGIIAGVFVLLALAMFDVFSIDFSRFQRAGKPARAGSFGTALGLGAISALLAGACVAPVLIWTLLLAAHLHQGGSAVGILLPFLLGLGMALPWPFAGAGLSFLPKPGRWMNRVKQGFGILVLLFAFHYGRLAWSGFAPPSAPARDTSPASTEIRSGPTDGVPWRPTLDEAMQESRATGKPLFVDLWATWCTACLRMDRTTLAAPRVVTTLEAFVPVKIQCEDLDEPRTAALMDELGAIGLPTFIVLTPRPSSP